MDYLYSTCTLCMCVWVRYYIGKPYTCRSIELFISIHPYKIFTPVESNFYWSHLNVLLMIVDLTHTHYTAQPCSTKRCGQQQNSFDVMHTWLQCLTIFVQQRVQYWVWRVCVDLFLFWFSLFLAKSIIIYNSRNTNKTAFSEIWNTRLFILKFRIHFPLCVKTNYEKPYVDKYELYTCVQLQRLNLREWPKRISCVSLQICWQREISEFDCNL